MTEYIRCAICCDNQRLVDVPTIVDAIIGTVRCHSCDTPHEIDEKYRRALLENLSPEIQTEEANEDGWTDWIHPLEDYQMSCCDCGLTHVIQFRLDDINQLNFRMK